MRIEAAIYTDIYTQTAANLLQCQSVHDAFLSGNCAPSAGCLSCNSPRLIRTDAHARTGQRGPVNRVEKITGFRLTCSSRLAGCMDVALDV